MKNTLPLLLSLFLVAAASGQSQQSPGNTPTVTGVLDGPRTPVFVSLTDSSSFRVLWRQEIKLTVTGKKQ